VGSRAIAFRIARSPVAKVGVASSRWQAWAIRSRLRPLIHVAGIIPLHFENILNYLKHPITNAVTEGLNAKIQWIKYSSRGFRNRERFKLPIYFHCDGLDLDPR
jgi:transposase